MDIKMLKMNYIKRACIYVLQVMFFLCIGFVVTRVWFNNTIYSYNKLFLAAVICASLFIVVFVGRKLRGCEVFLEDQFVYICTGFLTIMAILQIVIGWKLRFNPQWGDMGAIYNGAISWVETGSLNVYDEYFFYFPNNIGLLVFFKVIFSVTKAIGIQDYFLVAILTTTILLTVMMWSIIIVCRKCLGIRYAVLAMLLLALSFPFYFISAAFYTDVMSMAAPALFYLLYLKSKETEKLPKKLFLYFSMALVVAIGAEIKFTVMIVVIAVVIDMLIKDKFKRWLMMLVMQIVIIAGVFMMVDHMVYPTLLDEEQARKQNTPYLHWIMMGLQGDGGYNGSDYIFTRSFDDLEQRDAALKGEIINRIGNHGMKGMIELFEKKTVRNFGDGTYGLSDFLDDNPVNETVLHDYVLYDGIHYDQYSTICHGVFLSVMILMLFGGMGYLFGKSVEHDGLVPRLTFLGLWAFLMIWEAESRYFSNFISMMLLSAVLGVDYFEYCLIRIKQCLGNAWETVVRKDID